MERQISGGRWYLQIIDQKRPMKPEEKSDKTPNSRRTQILTDKGYDVAIVDVF